MDKFLNIDEKAYIDKNVLLTKELSDSNSIRIKIMRSPETKPDLDTLEN